MKNGRIRQIGAISLSLVLSFLAIACDGSGFPRDPVPDLNDETPIQQPDGNVNNNTNNNVNDNSDNNVNENANNNTNDNASDENPPPEPAAPSPIGEWIVESGHLLPIAATVDFPALILREDGTGNLVGRDESGLIHECLGAGFLIHKGELIFDLSPGGFPIGERYLIVQDDNDTLALVNSTNLIAVLSRRESLPDDLDCKSIQSLHRIDDVPSPSGSSNLVFLDGNLFYTVTDSAVRTIVVNANTGQHSELSPSIQGLIQAVQGDAFWTHCGCGGSVDATLRTGTQTLETINTDTELGHKIQISAMAVDEATGIVWLHGPAADNSGFPLLRARIEAGAAVLVDSKEIGFALSALAWDGENLWGVARFLRGVVVKIDPETGEVLMTIQVPELGVFFEGIAFGEGRMFLLGKDADQKGVIAEVAIPE